MAVMGAEDFALATTWTGEESVLPEAGAQTVTPMVDAVQPPGDGLVVPVPNTSDMGETPDAAPG